MAKSFAAQLAERSPPITIGKNYSVIPPIKGNRYSSKRYNPKTGEFETAPVIYNHKRSLPTRVVGVPYVKAIHGQIGTKKPGKS